jgi:hypothetical protein
MEYVKWTNQYPVGDELLLQCPQYGDPKVITLAGDELKYLFFDSLRSVGGASILGVKNLLKLRLKF